MSSVSQNQKRGPDLKQDDLHPFEPGAVVTILAFRPYGGAPFIEGRAEVLGLVRQAHYYRVRFARDGAIRIRFVHPDYQTGDPQRHLQLLVELWHTSQFPDFENFFPDLSI